MNVTIHIIPHAPLGARRFAGRLQVKGKDARFYPDAQRRKQDRELAEFIEAHAKKRIEQFATLPALPFPINDVTAPFAFDFYYRTLRVGLYLLGIDILSTYGFTMRTTKFISDQERRRVLDDAALHHQLVAKIGEYREIQARLETLILCRDDASSTSSENYQRYSQMIGPVSVAVWYQYCLVYCIGYGANDILPGMVESLTRLGPHKQKDAHGNTIRFRGNRLYKALSQYEDDPDDTKSVRQRLWVELVAKLPPGQMPSMRKFGGSINRLRTDVNEIITKENPWQPETIPMDAPIGKDNSSLTIGDTLASPDDNESIAASEHRFETQIEAKEAIKQIREQLRTRQGKISLILRLDKEGHRDQAVADMLSMTVAAVRACLKRHRPKKS
jgi:hypothetical protein